MIGRVARTSTLELVGWRVRLKTLTEDDYDGWYAVRSRCRGWLVPWEPSPAGAPPMAEDRASFAARCAARERERQLGGGIGFGIFLEGTPGRRDHPVVHPARAVPAGLHRLLDRRGPGGQGSRGRGGRGRAPLRVRRARSAQGGDRHRPAELAEPTRRARSWVCARRGSPSGFSRSTANGRTTSATRSLPRSGSASGPVRTWLSAPG